MRSNVSFWLLSHLSGQHCAQFSALPHSARTLTLTLHRLASPCLLRLERAGLHAECMGCVCVCACGGLGERDGARFAAHSMRCCRNHDYLATAAATRTTATAECEKNQFKLPTQNKTKLKKSRKIFVRFFFIIWGRIILIGIPLIQTYVHIYLSVWFVCATIACLPVQRDFDSQLIVKANSYYVYYAILRYSKSNWINLNR